MNKIYSKEILDRLSKDNCACIITFYDDTVYAGRLSSTVSFSPYHLLPFGINDGGVGFKRSHVKQIVLFNGLIVPKEENGKHKLLDIIQLNELINKAGYEFI